MSTVNGETGFTILTKLNLTDQLLLKGVPVVTVDDGRFLNTVNPAPQTVVSDVKFLGAMTFDGAAYESMASFSANSSTGILGLKAIYRLTAITEDTTFTILDADIAKATPANPLVLTIMDASGSIVSDGFAFTILAESGQLIDGSSSVSITADYGVVTLSINGTTLTSLASSPNSNITTQLPKPKGLTEVDIFSPAQMPLTLAADGNMRWAPVLGIKYTTHGPIEMPLIAMPESLSGDPQAVEISPANQNDALLFNGSDIPHIWGRNNTTFVTRASTLLDISNGGAGGSTVLFDLVGSSFATTLVLDNAVMLFFKSIGNAVDMQLDVASSTCVSCAGGLTLRNGANTLGSSLVDFVIINPFLVASTSPFMCFMGDFATVSQSVGNIQQSSSGVAICIDSAATGTFDIIGNSFDGVGEFFAPPLIKAITLFAQDDVAITGFSDSSVSPGVDTTVEFAGITDAIIGQEILIADELAYDGLHTIVRVASDQLSFDINVVHSTSAAGTLKRTKVTATGHFMVRDQTNTISGTAAYNATQKVFKVIDADNILISVAFVTAETSGTVTATSKNEASVGVDASLNGAAKNSRTIGFGELNGNLNLTAVTASTYTPINVTGMTENPVSERFSLTNAAIGEFTYFGEKPITGEIQAVITASKAGSTEKYRFSLSVNGAVPVFATAAYAPMEVKTTEVDTTVLAPFGLASGDTVQVMQAGDGTGDDLTISDAVIRVGGG